MPSHQTRGSFEVQHCSLCRWHLSGVGREIELGDWIGLVRAAIAAAQPGMGESDLEILKYLPVEPRTGKDEQGYSHRHRSSTSSAWCWLGVSGSRNDGRRELHGQQFDIHPPGRPSSSRWNRAYRLRGHLETEGQAPCRDVTAERSPGDEEVSSESLRVIGFVGTSLVPARWGGPCSPEQDSLFSGVDLRQVGTRLSIGSR